MSLTLLVENNPQIESFYRLNLTTWLDLQVITKKNATLALPFLESPEGEKIKLIIVRSRLVKEEAAKMVVEFCQRKALNTPVVEIGPGKEVPGCFAHVPNSLQLKILIQSCAKALNITAKEMSLKVVPDHYPIAIEYFKPIKRSVCDVFIQDKENPAKFNLKIKKNVDFEETFFDSLMKQGVSFLYVEKKNRLDFVHFVTSELMSKLESSEISADEEVTATEKSIELLTQKLLTIGITEETVTLANKNIEVIKKNVKINLKLSKLMDRLQSNKASYLFRHTQILTYVGMHIVSHIDWGNADQEEKIAFISFFHDICLETDEQALIQSSKELKKSHLDVNQKALVEKHAQLAAELVTKFPHAPMGSDQIIRQHHGTLNGLGYAEHFGNNVSPMSIVFIVAEEFTRIILRREIGSFDKGEMLKELKEKFPTSRFQKVIDLLQTITF